MSQKLTVKKALTVATIAHLAGLSPKGAI